MFNPKLAKNTEIYFLSQIFHNKYDINCLNIKMLENELFCLKTKCWLMTLKFLLYNATENVLTNKVWGKTFYLFFFFFVIWGKILLNTLWGFP